MLKDNGFTVMKYRGHGVIAFRKTGAVYNYPHIYLSSHLAFAPMFSPGSEFPGLGRALVLGVRGLSGGRESRACYFPVQQGIKGKENRTEALTRGQIVL